MDQKDEKIVKDTSWSQAYLLGVDVLDQQHQSLVKMANDLFNWCTYEEHEEAVAILKEYVLFHFREEEALMERVEFPGRVAHSAIHSLLEEKVHNLPPLTPETMDERCETLRNLLIHWLFAHILVEDARLAAYMKETGRS